MHEFVVTYVAGKYCKWPRQHGDMGTVVKVQQIAAKEKIILPRLIVRAFS